MVDTTGSGALIGTEDTAARLGVTVRCLRRWIQNGDAPPSCRIGKRRYFRREDVEAWLDDKFGDSR